ncbi:hypothetical protein [Agromyces mangrovi Wang et al. 2018]|uniref:hypothetical protein n=1 Tax=Agromyces mangrovi TaxID=1858653 RepID=UPI0025744EEE|nr:hypothetical protein [Agromyces mangrovi]BDZ65876.1 hypothetical protein GCM10025877_28140 [Agromyces mangrovi]
MSTTTGGGRREDELREALRGRADAAEPAIDVDAIAARGARIRRARRQGVVAVAAGVFAVAALGGVVWATLPGSGGDTIAASAPDERADEESADASDAAGAAESADGGGQFSADELAADRACAGDAVGRTTDLAVASDFGEVLDAEAPMANGRIDVRNDAATPVAGEAELRVELLAADGTLLAAGVASTVPLDLGPGDAVSFDVTTVPVPCVNAPLSDATAIRSAVIVQLADGSAVVAAEGAAAPVRVD